MADDDPDAVVYSQLIRPPSMRSIYWRFFGFPGDSNGQILTRHKIVCKLCNKTVAYNRNTTNLMVHLRNRHRGVIEAARAQQPLNKRLRYVYEPHVVSIEAAEEATITSSAAVVSLGDSDVEPEGVEDDEADDGEEEEDADVDDQLNKYVVLSKEQSPMGDDNNEADMSEPFIPTVEEEDEVHHGDDDDDDEGDLDQLLNKGYTVEYVHHNTDDDPIVPADSPPKLKSEPVTDNNQLILPDYDELFAECETTTTFAQQPSTTTDPSTSDDCTIKIPASNADHLLLNVLIENMSTDLINCDAFAAFCSSLNPGYSLPSFDSIETALEQRYVERQTECMNHLRTHLHDAAQRNYFSIGVDRWTTQNHTTYLTVYVFHVDDGPPARLETTILAIVPLHRSANWSNLLQSLPLDRCTAAVLNFQLSENPALQSFLGENSIPTVHCLHHAITEAARQCFETAEVHAIFATISAELLPLLDDATIAQIPPIHAGHWHTRIEYLQFVQSWLLLNNHHDHHDLDDNDSSAAFDLQQLIGAVLQLLDPLRVAQQTIVSERTAGASLVHPIVQQLLQNHFATPAETDDDGAGMAFAVAEPIRAVVNSVFAELGLIFNRLSLIASTLDPRFQSLIDGGQDLPLVRQELRRHCGDHTTTTTVVKADQSTGSASKLSSFLRPASSSSINVGGGPTPRATRRHRLDVELDAYVAEVDADLEQCPLAWWQTIGGDAFSTLAGCARRYSCIPAVLQGGRRTMEQQMHSRVQRAGLLADDRTVVRSVWLQEDLCGQTEKH